MNYLLMIDLDPIENGSLNILKIMKVLKSNSTFLLVQTITDQILLVVNGTISQTVLKVWHISNKENALNYFHSITH